MELTALRIATVAALLNGGNEPYPTLAGPFVFDSLIDDVSDLVANQRRPTVMVRTDDDVTMYRGNSFNGRTARLFIEAGVLTAATVKIGGEERLRVDWPRTDPGLEAQLDVLVWQIWNALRGMGPWAVWMRSLGYGLYQRASATPRFSPPQKGTVRQAVKTIEVNVTLKDDCFPPPMNELDAADNLPYLPPGIRNVLNYIYDHGAGDFRTGMIEVGKMLNRYGATTHPVYPSFKRAWTKFENFDFESQIPLEQGGLIETWEIPQSNVEET
jgi:hypothetical protein